MFDLKDGGRARGLAMGSFSDSFSASLDEEDSDLDEDDKDGTREAKDVEEEVEVTTGREGVGELGGGMEVVELYSGFAARASLVSCRVDELSELSAFYMYIKNYSYSQQ